MRIFLLLSFCFFVGFLSFGAHPSPDAYPIQAVPFDQVRIEDTFWKPRLDKNRDVTLPHLFGELVTHGTIDNFAIAGKSKTGVQQGVYPFNDSDLYKTLEAASYSLKTNPNPRLAAKMDSLIALIAKAQEPDGYLYTARTNNAPFLKSWANAERWKGEERSHELYNAGHLYEAAVANFKSTGKRDLLDIALKNADLVLANFGEDSRQVPPGHQEIELALPKLYEVTQNRKYLDEAQFLLDMRGNLADGRKSYGEYAQDHKPVTEQDEAVGHAVRAGYMCSSLLDVSAFNHDPKYAEASHRLWENVVSKKLYVTGGIGQTGQNEGFSSNYDLPNMSAYQETCSSISNIMWNHRLFLTYGDAKYLDILERTLYNAFLSGVGLSGDRFFYDNPLASNGQHERTPWFDCACCPPNVARFFAKFPELVYATRNNDLFVNLYVQNSANISLNNNSLKIKQETNYPWNGNIRLTLQQGAFDGNINLRLPAWSKPENNAVPSDLYRFSSRTQASPTIRVNGKIVPIFENKGFAQINRSWKANDVIELTLPMPVRRIEANEQVVQDHGRIAVQRGAFVYALEGADNLQGEVHNVFIPNNASFTPETRPNLLGGIVALKTRGFATRFAANGRTMQQTPRPLVLVPYALWSHRGRSDMTVWIPTNAAATLPSNAPSVAQSSKSASSGGAGLEALNDEKTGANAFIWQKDATNPNKAWIEYQFGQIREVSQVEVYWLTAQGTADVPKSWRISANVNGKWSPVWSPAKYWGVEKNRFNKTYFETVRTDAIRLEADLPESTTSGVLEWRVR
jgi:DUF1680 family protein